MIELHEGAVEDLENAARYYEARSPGLGEQLVDEVERGFAVIEAQPGVGAPVKVPGSTRTVRRLALRRYPFTIVYTEQDTSVMVLAVAHMRRRPGYWFERT